VTGAGGGIGFATVERLAGREVNVLAVDMNADGAARAADAAKRTGGDVVAYRADVSDRRAVEDMVRAARERWGSLNGLFNNAAIEGPILPVTAYSEEDFDCLFRTNVKSVWLGMKYAIPALLEGGGGAILNTASTAGVLGWPRMSGYVSSKHAVVGLTRAVAMECAGLGVRVNAICPGPTDTRMIWSIGEAFAPGDPAKARRLQELNIPIGRLGRPAEIASVAVWLLLDAPEYLTGAVLPADGGQTAGYGEHREG
jgi:NAD(P)-dependent dehydrogenase (short-subunit alcohol dehydrogenase family)